MKKITLSLLATTILSTAANAAAPKEPEIYFYPSKAWVVGKASEDSKQCAVQSEFNNGFVLQFDGDDKWLQSFSVNFRQAIFNEGQNYDVTLGIPGATGKKLSATATSNTTLTIPMQNEREIYQAARNAAVMDITVDANSFRFYLVNFGPAATNFESCMAGGTVQPAPATPAQDTPASVTAATPAPVAAQPEPQAAVQTELPQAAPQPVIQSELAPPPPNADPENIALLNESISFEEQETKNENAPIIDLSEDRKPTMQPVTVTEKVTLGDEIVIQEKNADEMNADVLGKHPTTAAATPATTPVAAAPSAPSPAQQVVEEAKTTYRKRMSEQLAEEMSASAGGVQPALKTETVAVVTNDLAPPQDELQAIAPTAEEKTATARQAAIQQPAPAPTPAPVRTAALQTPQPMPAAEEPFAKPGIILDTDAPPPAAMPTPVQKKVETIRSPDMIVHKETQKMDADFTGLDNVEPASSFNEPFARKADPDMLRKISELEGAVAKLQNENVALNDELKNSVQGSEQERLSISSENWNLERATMRYNESERQLKRLGEQVARERALCSGEKQDLETQLFDPRITDQQQLARLSELEQKLAVAERKLEDQRMRYEDRLRVTRSPGTTQ